MRLHFPNPHPNAPESNCATLAYERKIKLKCTRTIDHWDRDNLEKVVLGNDTYWLCPGAIAALNHQSTGEDK